MGWQSSLWGLALVMVVDVDCVEMVVEMVVVVVVVVVVYS